MYDIVTIGTATHDVFLTGKGFKIIKDPAHLKKIGIPSGEAECFALGAKLEVDKPVHTTGGGATNSAVTFARQGLKTSAFIKIGNDESGRIILNELKNERVSAHPSYAPKHSTAYSVVLLAPTRERTILVYRGASGDLNEAKIPFGKLKTKWVYIVPGNIPFQTIGKMISRFNKQKTLVAINPSRQMIGLGLKKIAPALSKCAVVILNREEAAALVDLDYKKEKEIFAKLDKIIGGIAVMTDGSNGVMVSDGKTIFTAKTFKEKNIVDRTGAGDAFGSGFVAGLIQTKELCRKEKCQPEKIKFAIRLGSANATSVIEKIGAKAGILTKKEFASNPRWKKIRITVIKK